ncbi:YaeQ family protein [Leeia oryzae]|uniref:YaeQ family protein n=1 Tax=Leeia oryzae TaxID=356662 RepID=UPI00036F8FCC|nr:YaeQ family protein [Leeia oryzae]
MAIKATVFKAELQIADMTRHYYQTHQLTLARHPSETDERMMVRLLAFALNASEQLEFGKGISTDDEADIWAKNYAGEIELWIQVGLPDPKWLRKASNRSEKVILYVYGSSAADIWWQQNHNDFTRLDNLSVFKLAAAETQALTSMAQRTMQLQCTIEDGQVWVADGENSVMVTVETLKKATA